jgi:Lar family restriction alleviation protein
MNNILKQCPFCGNKNLKVCTTLTDTIDVYVFCGTCGSSGERIDLDYAVLGNPDPDRLCDEIQNAKVNAVDAWNYRVVD